MGFNRKFDENEREYLDEREAIAMCEGGLSEQGPKDLAYTCYIHRFRPDCVCWYPIPEVR